MMPAAKHFDPVLGVDIHIIQPPGPVPPVPVPHPFVGFIIDPFDYAPIIGATVLINGMYRALAGTMGKCVPPHIPIGGVFVKPPANECEMFMGSSTVCIDGDAQSYLSLPALSCHCIGMPPVPRLKKKGGVKSMVLPTSVVLPIPAGPPVLIGGPPTISLMALGMKVGMAGLGKAFKRLAKSNIGKRIGKAFKKAKQKMLTNMKPGFLKCKVLKAEPVDITSGEVVVDQQDFSIPGRIPIDWNRHYGSHSDYQGVCGYGWETPADARLELDEDGVVLFCDGGPGATVFPSLPRRAPVTEPLDGGILQRTATGLAVVLNSGLTYEFSAFAAGAGRVLVQRVRDQFGNWVEYVRDQYGLQEIRESAGRRIKVRSRGGLVQTMELRHPESPDPQLLVHYEYDEAGDLRTVYDALENPYRFAYDQHRLIRHTDRNRLSFYYEHERSSPEWRCVHSWGDGGLYDYHFDYDDLLGQTRFTDSRGAVWAVQLDEHRLPLKETDPLGGETRFEYDDLGRTTAVTDPLGNRTEWSYDQAGNVLSVQRADGTAAVMDYMDDGRPKSLTDPNGHLYRFEHDRGRMISRTSPRGGTWRYEYNLQGDLVRATDPTGRWSAFERDRYGNVVATTDPTGQTVRMTRDAWGNITSRQEAGSLATYRYSAKGLLQQAEYPSGHSVYCEYDAQDQLVAYTDENGRTTRLNLVGLGEVAERIQPDGSRIRYRYDTEEQLVAVINERGEQFLIERDPLGRVTRETDYWGQNWLYEYDAAGNPVTQTSPAGERLTFQFDPLGRIIQRILPDGTAEQFEYDANGNILAATNPAAEVQRTFDEDGNLAGEAINGISVTSEFDLAGRRIRRTTSLGNDLRQSYDRLGRAAALILNDRPLLETRYDLANRLAEEQLGAALHRTYRYDAAGRLGGQVLRREQAVISQQDWSYDAAGQLLERLGAEGPVRLEYDASGRVTRQIAADGAQQELVYDAGGDLLRASDARREPGELRAACWKELTCFYDAAGRVVRRQHAGRQSHFRWDAMDRLVACTDHAGKLVTFGYDALGRRVSKTVGQQTCRFAWDEDRLLADLHQDLAPREFVFRPYTFDPVACINGRVCYYETDQVSVPHTMVDEQGGILWRASYGPLGDVQTLAAEQEDSPLRLQGQYYDRETGLAYNRHRYYDPQGGAFLTQDPLRLRAGPNLYRYAPNVWSWVDLFGLSCTKTVTVYRVEGPGNARVHVDANGKVTIPDKNKMLHISFGSPEHADYFLQKTKGRGHTDNVIKTFDVPESVVQDIQSRAVPQRQARNFPGAPQIDDPHVSKRLGKNPKDCLGVRGADLEALEANAIPGSGKVL